MTIKKYLAKLEDLFGKEVLITGGTSGIGLAIVRHLLAKNAKVTILARNLEKYDDSSPKYLMTAMPSLWHTQIKRLQWISQAWFSTIQGGAE